MAKILLVAALAVTLAACGSDRSSATPRPAPTTPAPTPSDAIASSTPTPSPTPALPTASPTPEAPAFPCGEPDPTCASLAVVQTRDLPFRTRVSCGRDRPLCTLRMDAFALPDHEGAPVVVMIPGGPHAPDNRGDLWTVARWVAARGAMVFTADYRSSPDWGGGYPATFQDVACAIRTARARATEMGANASRVLLVSHSLGGFPGALLAVSPRDFTLGAAGCKGTLEDGRPDAFLGIAGLYTFDEIGPNFLTQLFGSDETSGTSYGWTRADVRAVAGEAGARQIPITLIVGGEDGTAPRSAAEALVRATGRDDIAMVDLPTATHFSILSDVVTVDLIARAALAP